MSQLPRVAASRNTSSRPATTSIGISTPTQAWNLALMTKYSSTFAVVEPGDADDDVFDLPGSTTFTLTATSNALARRIRKDDEDVSWTSVGPSTKKPPSKAQKRVASPLPRVATLAAERASSALALIRKDDASLLTEGGDYRPQSVFGVAANGKPARAHDYVWERVNHLRNNAAAREAFFEDVAQIKEESLHKTVHDVEAAQHAWAPETTGVCHTPAVKERQRCESRQGRDNRMVEVALRREEQEATRARFLEAVVDDTYRQRAATRTVLNKKEQDALRARSWAIILTSLFVIPKQTKASIKFAKAEWERTRPRYVPDVNIAAAVNALVVLQKWWRRCVARVMYRRQERAIFCIRVYLKSMHKTKVRFCVALHLTRITILKIQRRWRAVRFVRQKRRLAAFALLAVNINRELHAIEKESEKLFKKRANLEGQAKIAIKVRKPYYDALLRENSEELNRTVARRTALLALTPESKSRLVEEAIKIREDEYNGRMLHLGKELDRRRKDVEEALRAARVQRSRMGMSHHAAGIKNGGLELPKITKPWDPIALQDDEIRAIVKIRGVALGTIDFRRDTLQMETTDPAILQAAEDPFPFESSAGFDDAIEDVPHQSGAAGSRRGSRVSASKAAQPTPHKARR